MRALFAVHAHLHACVRVCFRLSSHACSARRLDSVLEQIALEDCSHQDVKREAALTPAPTPLCRVTMEAASVRAHQARPLSPSLPRRPLSAFAEQFPRAVSATAMGGNASMQTQSPIARERKFLPNQRSPAPLIPAPASPRLLRAKSPLTPPASSRFDDLHRVVERPAAGGIKLLIPVDVMGVGVRMADQKSKQFQDRLRLMGL